MSCSDALARTRLRERFLALLNRRQRSLIVVAVAVAMLAGVMAGAQLFGAEGSATRLELRNLAPSVEHLFGTDWLGRDMLARTFEGLTLSLVVGVVAATASALIALGLGLAAATMGKTVDVAITWLIDLFLGVPHLLALILIAFALGGGVGAVIIGVALTHWPILARVIRAEVLQLRSAEFVQVSRKLGRSRWWVATRHILPHLMPQMFVGLVLLFPHAILHEAAITFLGFGLRGEQPAIGVILSESMRYLSTGQWWLAFFPGLALLVIVRTFDVIGDNLRAIINPYTSQE